jgi:hypothetical protein
MVLTTTVVVWILQLIQEHREVSSLLPVFTTFEHGRADLPEILQSGAPK